MLHKFLFYETTDKESSILTQKQHEGDVDPLADLMLRDIAPPIGGGEVDGRHLLVRQGKRKR